MILIIFSFDQSSILEMWQELSKGQWKKWAKANKKLIVFMENSVIDLTQFAHRHPGGYTSIKDYENTDVKGIFFQVYSHPHSALKKMQNFSIGLIRESSQAPFQEKKKPNSTLKDTVNKENAQQAMSKKKVTFQTNTPKKFDKTKHSSIHNKISSEKENLKSKKNRDQKQKNSLNKESKSRNKTKIKSISKESSKLHDSQKQVTKNANNDDIKIESDIEVINSIEFDEEKPDLIVPQLKAKILSERMK